MVIKSKEVGIGSQVMGRTSFPIGVLSPCNVSGKDSGLEATASFLSAMWPAFFTPCLYIQRVCVYVGMRCPDVTWNEI